MISHIFGDRLRTYLFKGTDTAMFVQAHKYTAQIKYDILYLLFHAFFVFIRRIHRHNSPAHRTMEVAPITRIHS